MTRPHDPIVLETEPALCEFFKGGLPDYAVEIGEGDFDTRASSFIFEKEDNRTIFYVPRGIVSQGYAAAVKELEKASWQTLVRDHSGETISIPY